MNIIALQGIGDSGKSTTLKLVVEQLIANGGEFTEEKYKRAFYRCHDTVVVINYKDKRIAINSYGDERKLIEKPYNELQGKVDMYICAYLWCGGTLEFIDELIEQGCNVTRIGKIRGQKGQSKEYYEKINFDDRNKVVLEIEKLIKETAK